MTLQRSQKFTLLLLIIGFISLPLFIHLDRLPIRIWDESRLAVNALEMHQNGNFLVTHFEGEPDMWNTKPPLMIWAQVAFIKVLGVNELAIRLPSALAAFATCLLLVFFSYKAFNDYRIGILAAFVLVTTSGYVGEHISRSGDYDALLTLFTTSYCLSFFLYLQKGKVRYLHLFFIALTLTMLTKSIQGLIFLPVLGLFALLQKKHLQFLLNKWFYINTALFIAAAATYFLLRESVNPGYLQAVWENDLGGRYSTDLVEGNRGDFYYLDYLVFHEFTYWLLFTVAGYFLGYTSKIKPKSDFSLYCLILTLSYLFIISTAQTKLPWYAAPLYPFLSFSAALALYRMLGFLQDKFRTPSRLNLIPYLFLIAVYLYPYQHILRKSYKPSDEAWDQDLYPISYVLQEAYYNQSSLNNHFVCYEDYSAQILFYVKALNDKGQPISYRSYDQIEVGDTIIAAEQPVKERIEEKFDYQVLRQHRNAIIYSILGLRINKPIDSILLSKQSHALPLKTAN